MSNYNTVLDQTLPEELVNNYFQNLVNRYFKILPMRENEEPSLMKYLKSLRIELLGCKGVIPKFENDPSYLTLLSILQYIIDNPDCPLDDVRREVFHAISICNKLQRHSTEFEGD